MRYAKKAILVTFVILLALILAGSYWILVVSPYQLPKGPLVFERLKPPSTGTLLDSANQSIAYFGRNDPVAFYKPFDQIDKKLREYVVMLEDDKFYFHKGFDVDEINNSFWQNLKAGKIKRGGSGITQQLAKNLFLDRQRSYARKLYEVPWTLKLESSLNKKQILELYLNSIEWGPGLAGAEAASRYFFGKSCSSLTPGEAMYLALIIPSPSRFNIIKNPRSIKGLEIKRHWFVNRLVSEKKISPEEKQSYMEMSFGVIPLDARPREFMAPTAEAFKLPDWGPYLRNYLKGKTSRVSILQSIQLKGNDSNSWIKPTEDNPTNASHNPASEWCAFSGEKVSGHWSLDGDLLPTGSFDQEVLSSGNELRPCPGIDLTRNLSL